MKPIKSWRFLFRKTNNASSDWGRDSLKTKQLPFLGVLCLVMFYIVYRTANHQYHHAKIEAKTYPFGTITEFGVAHQNLNGLPRGIIEARSDLELRPLWSRSSSRSKVNNYTNSHLLAIPVGINQKHNVDAIVKKFLPVNFTVILFHYDGNVDGWRNLDWSNEAIHIVAQNQTKWWFAKRFLHPAVVSVYDFIFLWDEDLGLAHFSPRRYLEIVKKEGLEISQPALDPNSTDIHHRITVRARTKEVHRRVYDIRGSVKCSGESEGPPCTGFVEGMAPVFSRSAWLCAWYLIQNDLVHGWGMDIKLGYCAQGDRTKKVGVVDSEYIVHKGIQTLGGSGVSSRKAFNREENIKTRRHGAAAVDVRTEIRRQSTLELQLFQNRWNQAVENDQNWVDPFKASRDQNQIRKRRRRKWHQNRL